MPDEYCFIWKKRLDRLIKETAVEYTCSKLEFEHLLIEKKNYDVLPLGSFISLKDGEQEIMIISRVPLYNNEGTIGYFDYAGCLYPQGQNSQMNY